MAFLSLTLAGAVALLGALPIVLQNAGLPAPGTEHAPAALLSKFRYVLPTDFRRFLYLIVPCGIYPAVCFFGWRKADDGSRALLVVTTLVFGMYYLMAFVSLHYFVPAMILPLAVFWRMQRTAEWKGGLVPAAACGTLVVTAIVLALPRTTSIYTATRSVGARLDASDLAGYEDMDASYFRGMQLLEELFLPGWKLRVPEQAYAGAALSWSFYAQRTPPSEDETTYVLARAETPPPKDALQVASNGETTLYVLDEATWDEHRTMRPEGSRGRGIYSVPRDLLFRRDRAFQRFAIIDIKGLLSRATRAGQ
jgi:hypothetical protein